MFIAPPYIYDYQVYPAVDIADRWLLNKMHLAEALGYHCGPCGVSPGIPGKYCLRPMNSVRGQGSGGWFEHDLTLVPNNPLPVIPGYFWCEWFDGENRYTHFVNDVAVHSSAMPTTGGVMSTRGNTAWGMLDHAVALPAFLQGKSRYMLVESLDDKIIEVGFRLNGMSAYQEVIDDYKTIDAAYDPQDITRGNADYALETYATLLENGDTLTGKTWSNTPTNRRPFDT
jgi:hypothetical protein